MKKSTRIVLIVILLVLSIVIITFTAIGFSRSHKAYAETTQFFNFNQAIKITESYSDKINVINEQTIYINTTLTGATSFGISNINISSTHKYYFYTDVPFVNRVTFARDYSGLFTSYEQYYIYSPTSDYVFNRIFLYGNESVKNLSFTFIDLTLMGIDDYTIEQCKELFTAQYYPFNSGTTMTLDSIALYSQAVNDIFANYRYSLSQNALSYTSYAVQYKNQSANFDYNTDTEQWYFQNTFAVPLFTTLNSGAQVTIDYYLYAMNLSQDWYLNVMYWSGNDYVTIYTSQETINTSHAQTMTFNLPYDTDTLYFNIVYNNAINTSANMMVFKFDISATQLDINSMIYSSFQSGYNSGYSKCESNYTYPNNGYMTIYNQGLAAADSGEVFTDSWGFAGSIFTSIGEILSIELIPNVPIGLFVALPLLVGLIFFIVKITKG